MYLAFVDVDFTTRSGKSGQTDARIGSNSVDTSAVVLARIRFAFVYVDIAIFSSETGSADTFVAVDQIIARSVVTARMRQAFVEF